MRHRRFAPIITASQLILLLTPAYAAETLPPAAYLAGGAALMLLIAAALAVLVVYLIRRDTRGQRPMAAPAMPADLDDPPEQAVTRMSPAEGSPRILVAEDNLTSQLVLKRMLEGLGFSVDIAVNGRRAVALFTQARYAAILMDARMPVMDGISATRAIRALEEGGHPVPIIAVTADTLQVDRAICLDAGMNGYLQKPVRRDDLVATLLPWCEIPVLGQRGVDPTADPVATGGDADFETTFMQRLAQQVLEPKPHTVRLVADSFLAESQFHLARINRSIARRAWYDLHLGATQLHRVSKEVGANRLAQLVTELDRLGMQASAELAGQKLRLIQQEYAQIRTALERLSCAHEDRRRRA